MKRPFRVIIAGSRNFEDLALLTRKMDGFLHKKVAPVILSGAARGADRLGEIYANDRKIPIQRYPAKWDRYGKNAGRMRNAEMAEAADAVVVFWDGISPGTAHMVDVARRRGLEVRIVITN